MEEKKNVGQKMEENFNFKINCCSPDASKYC
jgi:hypothetical protein